MIPGVRIDPAPPRPRLHVIDIGRTLALAGMIVFHIARDLEIFGVLPPGTTLSSGWAWFAQGVAGSFFFLAGVSLVLAHGRGQRLRAFIRRVAVIAAAALAVTVATYFATPASYIYFGILHSIALCSVIGAGFVALPRGLTLLAVAGVLALHFSGVHPLSAPVWAFTGLGAVVRPTLDFLPVVPWLAALLLGIAAAKGWQPAPPRPSRLLSALGWPGRHSLLIYLLHQPVLVGLLWLWLRVLS